MATGSSLVFVHQDWCLAVICLSSKQRSPTDVEDVDIRILARGCDGGRYAINISLSRRHLRHDVKAIDELQHSMSRAAGFGSLRTAGMPEAD
jgi:hypothetical protein